MITKITSTQNMVNLVDKGKLSRVLQVCLMKLIEANNTYINTYVLSPTTLDDFVLFMVMNNMKVIIGYEVVITGYRT